MNSEARKTHQETPTLHFSNFRISPSPFGKLRNIVRNYRQNNTRDDSSNLRNLLFIIHSVFNKILTSHPLAGVSFFNFEENWHRKWIREVRKPYKRNFDFISSRNRNFSGIIVSLMLQTNEIQKAQILRTWYWWKGCPVIEMKQFQGWKGTMVENQFRRKLEPILNS